jgi:NAD(P)-dependent dehydrogenase (short-subunit alcohol dehydrogenase family)
MAAVVVISGSTSSIARAVARKFARKGAMVAFIAPHGDELHSAAVEAVSLGATAALGLPCDLSDPEDLAVASERIERELGPVDIWIDTGLEEHDTATWKRAIAIGAGVVGVAGIAAIAWRTWRAARCR